MTREELEEQARKLTWVVVEAASVVRFRSAPLVDSTTNILGFFRAW